MNHSEQVSLASIQEEEFSPQSVLKKVIKQSPKLGLEKMLKQESKSRLLVSNDQDGYKPVLKY